MPKSRLALWILKHMAHPHERQERRLVKQQFDAHGEYHESGGIVVVIYCKRCESSFQIDKVDVSHIKS